MKAIVLIAAMLYTLPAAAIDTGLGEPVRLRAVLFSSPDCTPCRRMKAEIVRDLNTEKLGWKIEFVNVEDADAATKFVDKTGGVIRVPQVVVIRGNDKVAAWYGYATPSDLAKWLNGCVSDKGSWK